MAVSTLALKGIAGLAAVSTVSIGGIYLYKHSSSLQENKKTNIDEFALAQERIWTSEYKPDQISSGSTVEVTIKLSTKPEENKSWSCKIKGKITNVSSSTTLGIKEQLNSLKTSIGIEDEKVRKPDKNSEFKHFFENCIRHRETDPSNNDSEITIDLGELKTESNKYKFESTEFDKLHTANFLSKSLKTKIGIPDNCSIESSQECSLTKDELSKVKFLGQENTSAVENTTATLKIKTTPDTNTFKNGLKFIFKTNADLTITQGSPSKTLKLKKDSNTELKLNIEESKYSLESAWTKEELMKKIGLRSTTTNEFIFEEGAKINVFISENGESEKYVIGATLNDENKSKKLTVEEYEGHNHGLKITVEEDIFLTGGTPKSSSDEVSKLTKTNKSYEIEHKKISDKEYWFLVEKSSS